MPAVQDHRHGGRRMSDVVAAMTESSDAPAALDTPQLDAAHRQRRRHWEMLVIASLALALSFILTIRDDGRVAVRFLQDLPVPELCLSKSMFHFECPACGLTRSFIALAESGRGSSHARI